MPKVCTCYFLGRKSEHIPWKGGVRFSPWTSGDALHVPGGVCLPVSCAGLGSSPVLLATAFLCFPRGRTALGALPRGIRVFLNARCVPWTAAIAVMLGVRGGRKRDLILAAFVGSINLEMCPPVVPWTNKSKTWFPARCSAGFQLKAYSLQWRTSHFPSEKQVVTFLLRLFQDSN